MSETGYEAALRAVQEGGAIPHALWVILRAESDRDGYALKPNPWEGPGQYQHIEFRGEPYGRFVRIPDNAKSLIDIYNKRFQPKPDPLAKIIALPPITLRQLNTIAAALKLAEVRYGMMLQLPRFDEIPALSHDEVGDLADILTDLSEEMKGGNRGRLQH